MTRPSISRIAATLVASTILTAVAIADEAPAASNPKVEKILVKGKKTYKASKASTATKTDTPILETPFQVQVVNAQVLEDQQSVRLDNAVRNVSAVTPTSSAGAGYGLQSGILIRGFTTHDYFRDGYRVASDLVGDGFREMANIDHIEVLKGPASILYGRMEPGGMINIVTRKPESTPHFSLSQQIGTDDFYRTTTSFGGPVGGDAAYRVDAAYEDSGSFTDFIGHNRVFLAPALTWEISPSDTLDIHAEYQKSSDSLNYGQFVMNNAPAPLPRSRNISGPDGELQSERYTEGADWEHVFSDAWSLHARIEATQVPKSDLTPSFVPFGTTAFFDGVGTCAVGACTIYLVPYKHSQNADSVSGSMDVLGKFSTGELQHTVLVGTDYQWLKEDRSYAYSFNTPVIDVFNPVYPPPASTFTDSPSLLGNSGESSRWTGVYAQDQISIDERFYLLAGARWDSARSSLFDASPSVSTDQSRVTPRIGVLYRPTPNISLYGNYVENFGLSQGRQQTTTGDSSPLPATTAQQVEVGAKGEFFDGKLIATIAYFDITKQNIAVTDPDPVLALQGFQRAIGEVENRGVEIDVSGQILPDWNIIANYAHIDSEITKDTGDTRGYDAIDFPTADPTGIGNKGRSLANVPADSGSIWTTYDVAVDDQSRVSLGAGVVIIGDRYGDILNSYTLPGYALVNLMGSYTMPVEGHTVRFQVNVDNLLDEDYFESGGNAPLRAYGTMRGAPRTVLASIRFSY